MTELARPTYQAAVQAALDSTGSARGWLLGVGGNDDFTVLAALGHPGAAGLVGQARAAQGAAGFVAASGQPAAMQIGPKDVDNAGAGGADGVPAALLAVPCGGDDVAGVIEIVDPANGSYSFDDVETVALLAEVVGAALGEGAQPTEVASPTVLAAGLSEVAVADPGRYAAIARVVEALL